MQLMNVPSPVLKAIQNYVAGLATPAEDQLVQEWFHAFDFTQATITSDVQDLRQQVAQRMWQKIDQAIDTPAKHTTTGRSIFYRYRWAAAACIAFLSAGAYFLFLQQQPHQQSIASQPQTTILPGTSKATLTLSDGSTITLDSNTGNTITDPNGIKIINLTKGQLAYNRSNILHHTSEISYNLLSTPRGGQYEVVLSDGSHIWLNAASALRYPNAFTGKERSVEISGEAYFEIAPNPHMPFKIKVNGGSEVEVLGTHININAYSDEATVKTTLLQGSIRVTNAVQSAILQPGEQCTLAANVANNQGLQIARVNTDEVIAWKNGVFNLHNIGVAEMMRQLSRWYDIEVTYEGRTPAITFWGEMSRSENLAAILDFMKESGIHFRIDNGGKKIIVTP